MNDFPSRIRNPLSPGQTLSIIPPGGAGEVGMSAPECRRGPRQDRQTSHHRGHPVPKPGPVDIMTEGKKPAKVRSAARPSSGGGNPLPVRRRPRSFPVPCVRLFLALAMLVPAGAAAQEEIRIGGTGGALSAMRTLASAYRQDHPEVKITVLPSLGSTGGIRAVLAGALDLGISSRPLKEQEKGARARPIGRTPFVFAMRRPAPISGLTMRQIEDLYAGRILHWPDDREARVVLRPEAEYDTMLLRSMSPAMDRTVAEALSREGMILAVTDQDNAHAIMTVPGTLGTMTAAQIHCERLPFTALALNGVRPAPETLASGAYPYSKTYYIVQIPDARPVVRRFIDFIYSPRGRAVLSRCGYQAVP